MYAGWQLASSIMTGWRVSRTASHKVLARSRPSPTFRPKLSLSSTAHVVHESPVTRAMHTKRRPVSADTVSRMVGTDEINWMDAMSAARSVMATVRYLCRSDALVRNRTDRNMAKAAHEGAGTRYNRRKKTPLT